MRVLCLLPDRNIFDSGLLTHYQTEGQFELRVIQLSNPRVATTGLWRTLRDYRPQRIHVTGMSALRTLALVGPTYLSCVILSQPPEAAGWLDRWLLRRVGQVVVQEARTLERCRRWGLQRVNLVSPAIAKAQTPAICESPHRIVCLATRPPGQAFRHAAWAFDILRVMDSSLELILVKTGEQRPDIERFVDSLNLRASVVFTDEADAVSSAGIVWVLGQGEAAGLCLQALSHGRPVITQRPVEVLGEAGLVAPPGDPSGLAALTWRLLQDEPRREAMRLAACGVAQRQRNAAGGQIPYPLQKVS